MVVALLLSKSNNFGEMVAKTFFMLSLLLPNPPWKNQHLIVASVNSVCF
jgi:hypothetical protein